MPLSFELHASHQDDESVTAIYQEYLSYMQYYSDNVFFMSKMMRLVEIYQGRVSDIRQGLVMTLFDSILASTLSHTQELIGPFISCVHDQFDHADFELPADGSPPTFTAWNAGLF